jgi:predicted DNA-binding transcriptional regulator AlpA
MALMTKEVPMRQGEARIEKVSARIASAAMGMHAEPGPVPIHLYDQESLALLLGVSKKTVQNLYSRTPHLLPSAIDIPGARGPRWTAQAILAWLDGRPVHTSTPPPIKKARKVGRPRIVSRNRDI